MIFSQYIILHFLIPFFNMFLFERQCYRKRTGSEREREKEREGGRHTERASTPRSFFKRPQQLHVGKTEARSQLPLLFLWAQGPQPFSRLTAFAGMLAASSRGCGADTVQPPAQQCWHLEF